MCPRLLRRKKTNKETTNQPNKQTNKIGNCGEEQKHTQEEEEGKKRTQESWRQESWLWCLKYTVPWRQSRTSQSNRPKGACLCVSSYLYVSHLHRAERVKVTVLKVHVYVCHVIDVKAQACCRSRHRHARAQASRVREGAVDVTSPPQRTARHWRRNDWPQVNM